jgi:putative spermidine/putrescine transport system ATP-binding protein
VLGGPVTLCLRPERISLLAYGEAADNMADAEILDVRSAGALLDVRMETALGPLSAAVPSWQPSVYPRAGQFTRVGWAAGAGHVVA